MEQFFFYFRTNVASYVLLISRYAPQMYNQQQQPCMAPPPCHPQFNGVTAPPTYEEHVMHYNMDTAAYHPYQIYDDFDPEGKALTQVSLVQQTVACATNSR